MFVFTIERFYLTSFLVNLKPELLADVLGVAEGGASDGEADDDEDEEDGGDDDPADGVELEGALQHDDGLVVVLVPFIMSSERARRLDERRLAISHLLHGCWLVSAGFLRFWILDSASWILESGNWLPASG